MIRLFLLIFCLLLPACKWFTGAATPYYAGFSFNVPDGTPSFRKGYADGCATILSSRGNSLMRQRYGGYHYDAKMIGNPEYRFGFSRGWAWCFQTTIGPNNLVSPDRFLMPYGNNQVFDMSAGNINSLWGGMLNGTEGKAMGETISPGFDGILGVVGSGGGSGALSGNPLWAGGSSGQFFGQ